MTKEQIQQQLAAIENSITTVNAALLQASSFDDFTNLQAQLVRLKAERTRLQLMLINLESAEAAIPMAMAAGSSAPREAAPKLSSDEKKVVKEASKALDASVSDRRVVQAALDQSNEVLDNVTKVQSILSGRKNT
jgi:hypothetical protein